MLVTVEQPKQAHLRDTFQSANSSTETLTVDTIEIQRKHAESPPPLDTLAELEKGAGVEKSEEDTFPDGGWEAWSCLFALWWAIFFSLGSVNSFGVYEQYYAKHLLLDKTLSQIAWIGAMQLFFCFSLGVVAGRFFDMGLLRPVLATSLVMLVL
jgi:hypothetical protein